MLDCDFFSVAFNPSSPLRHSYFIFPHRHSSSSSFSSRITTHILYPQLPHYPVYSPHLSESGGLLQKAYARQLIADLKETIVKDPNYSADKYTSLNAIIS